MFLKIEGIKKSFGSGENRVEVLKGLNLEIERGEFCVLLGPSGSGKSTLLFTQLILAVKKRREYNCMAYLKQSHIYTMKYASR